MAIGRTGGEADGLARTRAVEATVRGVVQGVGFRWFASREANRAGVAGWVANQADGSVFVVAEGEAAAVEAFLAALREGPPGASVSSVEVSERMATGASGGFGIRSGAHRGD
jgi:acylphosphatase